MAWKTLCLLLVELAQIGPRWAPCWPHEPCYQGVYVRLWFQWHWWSKYDFYVENGIEARNGYNPLTHGCRVTHICVRKLTTIGSAHGLSPGQRKGITWTNPGILLTGPFGTNFSEILTEIVIFSFKKMRLKMSFGKLRSFCLGLSVLMTQWFIFEAHNRHL